MIKVVTWLLHKIPTGNNITMLSRVCTHNLTIFLVKFSSYPGHKITLLLGHTKMAARRKPRCMCAAFCCIKRCIRKPRTPSSAYNAQSSWYVVTAGSWFSWLLWGMSRRAFQILIGDIYHERSSARALVTVAYHELTSARENSGSPHERSWALSARALTSAHENSGSPHERSWARSPSVQKSQIVTARARSSF